MKFGDKHGMYISSYDYTYPNCGGFFSNDLDVFFEAYAPIARNAIFYGVAASERANGRSPVVVGTANFSEAAFLGFWGKASDGAQDFYPISHLDKMEVYELARLLNAPPEVINAIPSGDLLFTKTNDLEMIGATYEQIEAIIWCLDTGHKLTLNTQMKKVIDPEKFANNIVRNSFKYDLPFPGVHVYSRLEDFRQRSYGTILQAARKVLEHA